MFKKYNFKEISSYFLKGYLYASCVHLLFLFMKCSYKMYAEMYVLRTYVFYPPFTIKLFLNNLFLNRSEYWKSQPKHFCKFCSCWIADNKPVCFSPLFYENNKRRTGRIQLSLKIPLPRYIFLDEKGFVSWLLQLVNL